MRKSPWWTVVLSLLVLLVVVGFLPPRPALAEGGSGVPPVGTTIARLDQPLVVPVGQTADALLLWGHDADIAGTVTDEVVVVQGDVTLRSTARIRDRVIAIGGRVNLEPGAQVGGGVLALDLGSATLNGLLLGLVGFGAAELVKLLVAAVLVVWSSAVSLAFGRRLKGWLNGHSQPLWRGFLAGLVVATGLGGAAALTALTVWGLPLALILMLIAMVGALFGTGIVALQVGKALTGTGAWPGREDAPAWLQATAGGTVLALLISFPVLGLGVAAALTITALGCSALYLLSPRQL